MAEPGKPTSSTQETGQLDRLALTLDTETGEILKCEAVDAAGNRRELSQNERLELARIRRGEAVEDLIEHAFEAGLACLLEGTDGPEDESETEEVASFRRALLRPLIEKSPVSSGPATGRASTRNRAFINERRPRFPKPETEAAKTQKEGRKSSKGSTSDK